MGLNETELMTVGQVVAPGYQLQLWHNPEEVFDPKLGLGGVSG